MTLYIAITTALQGRTTPIAGRDVAEAAGIAYKAAIDALGRMLDAGTVVRYGRKRFSTWALTAAPAGATPDPLGAVEAAWRARPPEATPTPRGEGQATPRPMHLYRSLPQKFSANRKSEIFFDRKRKMNRILLITSQCNHIIDSDPNANLPLTAYSRCRNISYLFSLLERKFRIADPVYWASLNSDTSEQALRSGICKRENKFDLDTPRLH